MNSSLAPIRAKKRISWSAVIALLILAAVIFAGFRIIIFRCDFIDEFYEIMNAQDYTKVPMAPLSAWLSGLYGDIAGWGYLPFKYLVWSFNVMACCVCGIWTLRLGASVAKASLLTAATLGMVLLCDYNGLIYGWDSYTILFTSVTLVLALDYLRRPSYKKLITMAFSASLLTLMRMPNAAVIIPMTVVVLMGGDNKSLKARILAAMLCAALYCVFTVGILSLLFGSVGGWIDAIHTYPMGDHSVERIIEVLLWALPVIAVYSAEILAVDWMMAVFRKIRTVVWMKIAWTFFIMAAYAIVIHWTRQLITGSYLLLLTVSVVMMTISVMFALPYNLSRIKAMVAVLLFGCVCFAGSNIGFAKYLTFAPLPIILFYLLPLLRGQRLMTFTAIVPVVLVFMYFSCLKMLEIGYRNQPLVLTEVPRLEGIPAPADLAADLTRIGELTSGNANVYALGEDVLNRFPYEFVYGVNPMMRHQYGGGDRHFDNLEYVEKIAFMLDTIPAGSAVIYTPHDMRQTPALDLLRSRLTEVGCTGLSIVFVK